MYTYKILYSADSIPEEVRSYFTDFTPDGSMNPNILLFDKHLLKHANSPVYKNGLLQHEFKHMTWGDSNINIATQTDLPDYDSKFYQPKGSPIAYLKVKRYRFNDGKYDKIYVTRIPTTSLGLMGKKRRSNRTKSRNKKRHSKKH